MTIENTISIAISIAIAIAIVMSISIAIFLFDITCFFFLDAGNGRNLVSNGGGTEGDDNNNNASNTQETATSNLETAIVVTSSTGAKTKASPPTVSPCISLFSPVMARLIPLSPYQYPQMQYFTSHKPCRLSDSVITPSEGQVEISFIAQTQTTDSVVTLPAKLLNFPLTDLLKPAPKYANDKGKDMTAAVLDFCHVRKVGNHTELMGTALQHGIVSGLPKPVKKPCIAANGTNNNITKSLKKHCITAHGFDKNNTKPLKKHCVAVNNITKSVKIHSIAVHGTNQNTKPVKKNCVTYGTNNNTKTRIQAKPVKKPGVVDGTNNTTIKYKKKHFVADENDTKPKVLISRKPPIPCAPRRSNLLGLQAKPVTKYRVVDGTNNTTTESVKKHFVADENDTNPKVLTSRKPPIPCAPRRSNLQGLQAKPGTKHRVVDGTDNNTSSDTKPKMLTSRKPPIPCAPRCSNLQGLQTSRPTAAVTVTPKGCIQRWRC